MQAIERVPVEGLPGSRHARPSVFLVQRQEHQRQDRFVDPIGVDIRIVHVLSPEGIGRA